MFRIHHESGKLSSSVNLVLICFSLVLPEQEHSAVNRVQEFFVLSQLNVIWLWTKFRQRHVNLPNCDVEWFEIQTGDIKTPPNIASLLANGDEPNFVLPNFARPLYFFLLISFLPLTEINIDR